MHIVTTLSKPNGMKIRFMGRIYNEKDFEKLFHVADIGNLMTLKNVGDSVALTRNMKAYQATRIK